MITAMITSISHCRQDDIDDKRHSGSCDSNCVYDDDYNGNGTSMNQRITATLMAAATAAQSLVTANDYCQTGQMAKLVLKPSISARLLFRSTISATIAAVTTTIATTVWMQMLTD